MLHKYTIPVCYVLVASTLASCSLTDKHFKVDTRQSLAIPSTSIVRGDYDEILKNPLRDPDHLIPTSLHPYSTLSPWFEPSVLVRRKVLSDVLEEVHGSDSWRPLAIWVLDPALTQPSVLVLQVRASKQEIDGRNKLNRRFRLLSRKPATEKDHWKTIENARFKETTSPVSLDVAQVIYDVWLAATTRTREPEGVPKGAISNDGSQHYFFAFDPFGRTLKGSGMTINPTEEDKLSLRMEKFALLVRRFAEASADSELRTSVLSEASKLLADIEKEE